MIIRITGGSARLPCRHRGAWGSWSQGNKTSSSMYYYTVQEVVTQFIIVTYYIKWVTTSWTDSNYFFLSAVEAVEEPAIRRVGEVLVVS